MAEQHSSTIQRTLIWSSWLRLSHWLIAIAVLSLAATGWLIEMTPSMANAASDYHYLFATVLIGGMVLRVGLLFSNKSAGYWQKLLPEAKERRAYKQILFFYLSLGKSPLPRWYAHNPFWKPIYLLLLLVLLFQILTGVNRDEFPIVLGFYLPNVHAFLASIIVGFTVLHIIAVVLHDLKGTTSDISAMIHGYKIFVVQKPGSLDSSMVHPVSLDRLKGNR